MTIKETLKAIKALGVTASYSPDYKEFRIGYRVGDSDSGYYTQDKDDALDTAKSMVETMKAGEAYRLL